MTLKGENLVFPREIYLKKTLKNIITMQFAYIYLYIYKICMCVYIYIPITYSVRIACYRNSNLAISFKVLKVF